MRFVSPSVGFGLMFTIFSLPLAGCGSDGTGGAGGTAGSGATGGGGGTAGLGGYGGSPQRCVVPSNCDDGDPCTTELCIDEVCAWDPLADDSVCGAETGLSLCLDGTCEPIWPSCTDEGAQEGDFCQPTDDMTRTGRCASGECEVGPCEIPLDCWDGNICTSGACNALDGLCSQENAPNGTQCLPPIGGLCVGGMCELGGGGQGGSGGQGGQGGQGGA